MMWPRVEPSPAHACKVLVGEELREREGERIILTFAGA